MEELVEAIQVVVVAAAVLEKLEETRLETMAVMVETVQHRLFLAHQ
jgi:hypothetical protein